MCGHVFGIIARMIMNNIANYIDDDKTEMVMIMMVMIATMARAARRRVGVDDPHIIVDLNHKPAHSKTSRIEILEPHIGSSEKVFFKGQLTI